MESSRNIILLVQFCAKTWPGVFIIFTSVFFLFILIICANSLEFSCLLWQPVINFSTATEKHVGAEAGPVQNPAGFHNENITNFKRPNFDLGRHENPLEENHWNLYKDLCLHLQKKSSESISNARKMYSFTRLARSWRSKDLRQLTNCLNGCGRCITTTNWCPGRSWRER